MKDGSDHFGLSKTSIGRCFDHYAGLSWPNRLALAFSSLLGLVLLVILSPILLPLAAWMWLTRGRHSQPEPAQPAPVTVMVRSYR